MPLFNKHLNEIKTELENAFKDATTPNIDLTPNTPIGNIIQQQSRNFSAVIDAINTLENKVNLNFAMGDDLTNLALLHGIQRLAGVQSIIEATLTFKDTSHDSINHDLKAGTQFVFDNNSALTFTLDTDLHVTARTMEHIKMTCVYSNNELINEHMKGVSENVDDNIHDVTITSFALGHSDEDDEVFRARILAILQGDKNRLMIDPEIARIKRNVLSVPYVEYVYCVHNRTAHTLKIYVDGKHYDEQAVADAIFQSVTAGVTLVDGDGAISKDVISLDNQPHTILFHKAEVEDVNVHINLFMDKTLYKTADYQMPITDIIMNYVNQKPINSTLYAAELNKIIMDKYPGVMIVTKSDFGGTDVTKEIDPGKRPKVEIDRIHITWTK